MSLEQNELIRITAADSAAAIAAGRLSSEALVRAYLARIAARDADVRAWSYLDRDHAIRQARERDKQTPLGPLHGVPVAIKDMIDTHDMPTQHNSPIYTNHRPGQDAACVSLLRSAGAVILGKTDTHEFAAGGRLALTRNPHDFACTPGGSSSGSAAAVADAMVPLALGTQTAGSTIRPASFCGIFAMKPTWGRVSREGAKTYSLILDTISWFGRSPMDLAVVAQAYGVIEAPPPVPAIFGLRIGLHRTTQWARAEPASRTAVEEAAARLRKAGATVFDLDLPAHFADLYATQNTVMRGDGRAAFLPEYRSHHQLLHQDFRDRVEDADHISPERLRDALDFAAACRPEFDRACTGIDAILTPCALGEAPRTLATTGDPTFSRMWTLLHAPCIAIPGFVGTNGLPIGVQLVAPRYADARLLAIAAAVSPAIGAKVATTA